MIEAIHVISCGYEDKSDWGTEVSNLASLWFISLFLSIFATGILEMRWNGVGIDESYFDLEHEDRDRYVNLAYKKINRAVQMRTIIGFENGGTNLGHLFHFAADQFSVAGALSMVNLRICISSRRSWRILCVPIEDPIGFVIYRFYLISKRGNLVGDVKKEDLELISFTLQPLLYHHFANKTHKLKGVHTTTNIVESFQISKKESRREEEKVRCTHHGEQKREKRVERRSRRREAEGREKKRKQQKEAANHILRCPSLPDQSYATNVASTMCRGGVHGQPRWPAHLHATPVESTPFSLRNN
ncbi:hypothetical protein LXL04_024876 [Taraxacum kok-saghyz]